MRATICLCLQMFVRSERDTSAITSACPQLRRLSLNWMTAAGPVLAPLAGLPSLEDLTFDVDVNVTDQVCMQPFLPLVSCMQRGYYILVSCFT